MSTLTLGNDGVIGLNGLGLGRPDPERSGNPGLYVGNA